MEQYIWLQKAALTDCLLKGNQQNWCGLQSCVRCYLNRGWCFLQVPVTQRGGWNMGLLGSGNISVSEKVAFQVSVGTTLRGFFKFSAKEKFLKVPPLPHSPNKMGAEWFHLVGLSWCLGCRGCRVAVAVRPMTLLQENWKCWGSWAALDLGLSQSLPGFLCFPWGRPSSSEAFSI